MIAFNLVFVAACFVVVLAQRLPLRTLTTGS